MNNKDQYKKELQYKILELMEKDTEISISEISRQAGITRVTARKYHKEITNDIKRRYEAITPNQPGSIINEFLRAIVRFR